MVNPTFCLPRSIRVKLNTGCQYRCKFCHQEGNGGALDVDPDEVVAALKILKRELGFYRVHFTGGEPTLYEKFAELLTKVKEIGFTTALTTNGQFMMEKLPLLKKAGLDSVNFSLISLDPYAFLKLQDVSFDVKKGADWAKNCIEKTVQNIIIANKELPIKVNCVVSHDDFGPQKVLEFCIQNGVKIRFLNNLKAGQEAIDNICKIIEKNNARLIGHEITLLSSSHRLDYAIGSYTFGVKCIRDFFLKSICGECQLRGTGECLEGFYGIRLENKPLMVRLCLNRSGAPYVQSFKSFLDSEQFREIKEDTANILKYLKKDSIIKEQENLD